MALPDSTVQTTLSTGEELLAQEPLSDDNERAALELLQAWISRTECGLRKAAGCEDSATPRPQCIHFAEHCGTEFAEIHVHVCDAWSSTPAFTPILSHSCSCTPHPLSQATDEDGIPLVAEHVEGVDNRCGRSAALSPYRWHMVQTVVEEEISALHSLAAAVMHATQRLDDASRPPPPPVRDVEPDEIVHIDDEPSPGEEEEEVLEADE